MVHQQLGQALQHQQGRWLGLSASQQRIQAPPAEDRDDYNFARPARHGVRRKFPVREWQNLVAVTGFWAYGEVQRTGNSVVSLEAV